MNKYWSEKISQTSFAIESRF